MWGNQLATGLRVLTRSKIYALTNIIGLAIGLAACLAILLFIRHQTSFETWMPEYGIFVPAGTPITPWGQQPSAPCSAKAARAWNIWKNRRKFSKRSAKNSAKASRSPTSV